MHDHLFTGEIMGSIQIYAKLSTLVNSGEKTLGWSLLFKLFCWIVEKKEEEGEEEEEEKKRKEKKELLS